MQIEDYLVYFAWVNISRNLVHNKPINTQDDGSNQAGLQF